MAVILNRVDSVPLTDDSFSFDFYSWLSVLIDTINENDVIVENQLSGNGVATFVTRKTTAQITALIDMNALPVLEVGALWMDTTIGKLKFLVTAAVSGVSNGVTETVTSV